MSRSPLTATAALVLMLGLAGCGSDSGAAPSATSSPSSSASSAAASTGDKISVDAFSFNAPDGWKEGDPSQMPSVTLLAVAVSADAKDGFADNINVLEDSSIVGVDTKQLQKGLETTLSNIASDVRIGDSVDVGGDSAVVVLATYPKYKTVQHAVEHAGKGYVVTYSFGSDVPENDQLALASSVASSWQWAS